MELIRCWCNTASYPSGGWRRKEEAVKWVKCFQSGGGERGIFLASECAVRATKPLASARLWVDCCRRFRRRWPSGGEKMAAR